MSEKCEDCGEELMDFEQFITQKFPEAMVAFIEAFKKAVKEGGVNVNEMQHEGNHWHNFIMWLTGEGKLPAGAVMQMAGEITGILLKTAMEKGLMPNVAAPNSKFKAH